MNTTKIMTVDEYIRSFSGHARKKLTELRKLVQVLAPDALEKSSYGMPGHFLNGTIN